MINIKKISSISNVFNNQPIFKFIKANIFFSKNEKLMFKISFTFERLYTFLFKMAF